MQYIVCKYEHRYLIITVIAKLSYKKSQSASSESRLKKYVT